MTKEQPLLARHNSCCLSGCCYNKASSPRFEDCCRDHALQALDQVVAIFLNIDDMSHEDEPHYKSEEGTIITKHHHQQKQSVTTCDLPGCYNDVSRPDADYCCHDHALAGNCMSEGFIIDADDTMSPRKNEVRKEEEEEEANEVDVNRNHTAGLFDGEIVAALLPETPRTMMTHVRDVLLRSPTATVTSLASKLKRKKRKVGPLQRQTKQTSVAGTMQ